MSFDEQHSLTCLGCWAHEHPRPQPSLWVVAGKAGRELAIPGRWFCSSQLYRVAPCSVHVAEHGVFRPGIPACPTQDCAQREPVSWARGKGSLAASGQHIRAVWTLPPSQVDPLGFPHGPEPRPTRLSVPDSTSIGCNFANCRMMRSNNFGKPDRLCCSPDFVSSPSPVGCGLS